MVELVRAGTRAVVLTRVGGRSRTSLVQTRSLGGTLEGGLTKLSSIAMGQCITELRAACRRPIEPPALEALAAWLQPNFERILDDPEGRHRWADHGHLMRENGRHIGALADFIAHLDHVDHVGAAQLTPAFELVSAVCNVGIDRAPECAPVHPLERLLRGVRQEKSR